ncbi:MAG: nitroreductase [Ruminococcaceae bacterium]|nr:nitroreductase [Oscillospiraceae bacterium]
MTDLEAINTRTARRTYTGQLNKADLRRLEHAVLEANLEGGLNITLLEDGADAFGGVTNSYGMFSGVRSLFVVAGRGKEADLFEKAGHAGERLVLEAVKLGLGTCWVGGTFNRDKIAASLPHGQVLVAVITVGPIKEGRGLLEKAVGRVTSRKRKSAEELMEVDGTPPAWFTAGVEAAACAPSSNGKQPVRFHWKDGVATAAVPDDSPVQRVDLGIAKLHFEIGAGGRFALGNGAAFTPAE